MITQVARTFVEVIAEAVKQEFLLRHPSFELMTFKGIRAPTTWREIRVTGKRRAICVWPAEFRLVELTCKLDDLAVSTLDAFLRYLYSQKNDQDVFPEQKEILSYYADITAVGKMRRLKRLWNTQGFEHRITHILARARRKGKSYTMSVVIAVKC